MWLWVDRLAGIVFDASLAAVALLSLVALMMLGCRQPARRIRLARSAIVCSLALIPLVALAPFPRFDLLAAVRHSAIIPEPDRAVEDDLPAQTAGVTAPLATPRFVGTGGDARWATLGPLTWRLLTSLYLAGLLVG